MPCHEWYTLDMNELLYKFEGIKAMHYLVSSDGRVCIGFFEWRGSVIHVAVVHSLYTDPEFTEYTEVMTTAKARSEWYDRIENGYTHERVDTVQCRIGIAPMVAFRCSEVASKLVYDFEKIHHDQIKSIATKHIKESLDRYEEINRVVKDKSYTNYALEA